MEVDASEDFQDVFLLEELRREVELSVVIIELIEDGLDESEPWLPSPVSWNRL